MLDVTYDLQKIIDIPMWSSRIENFIWIQLVNSGDETFAKEMLTTTWFDKELVGRYLSPHQNAAGAINRTLRNSLIPEENLNWINGENRQHIYLESYIQEVAREHEAALHQLPSTSPKAEYKFFPISCPVNLIGRSRIVALFDYFSATHKSSVEQICQFGFRMRSAWDVQKETDKKFDWLDGRDAERKRAFFHNWLKGQFLGAGLDVLPFRDHADVLVFFQRGNFFGVSPDACSQNARKTWNQQQRRAKMDDKKQCNFILSKTTVDKIKKLADKHDLTRNEIIEILIDSEFKYESHINQRLSRKMLLKNPIE